MNQLNISDVELENTCRSLFHAPTNQHHNLDILKQSLFPSICSDGKLISIGDKIRLPDDVTIGYIIGHLLSKKLTEVEEFHSHLESMSLLKKESLRKQVSLV